MDSIEYTYYSENRNPLQENPSQGQWKQHSKNTFQVKDRWTSVYEPRILYIVVPERTDSLHPNELVLDTPLSDNRDTWIYQ